MREVLWGRDRELAELASSTDAARAGRGRVVLITGPAGIGKSALVETWSPSLEGFKVLRGRAWEFADAPPYFPVAPMLRQLGIDPEREGSPFALWEDVLDGVAKTNVPTAWIIEDAHAADLQTLDLLVFLAQPVRSLPLLVIVTRRDVDPRVDARVGQRLERLGRSGLELRPSALDERAVSDLAERWLGRPLGKGEARSLAERTEGNPLFVVEMARAGGAHGLPRAIRDVVLERVTALPSSARRALEAGAILGREFSAGHVGRMVDLLPARVIDDLAPAMAVGLVRELRPGMFAFGHIVERDAIDESLRAEERAALHARAAAMLASAGDSPDVIALRARHALDGVQPGDEVATIELVTRVIDALERQRAYDRAFALAERLDAARKTTLVGFPASPEELLRMASLAHRAGRDADWRRLCNDVMARTRTKDGASTFARAALLLGAELRPGFADKTLASTIDEALALLDGREPALECLLRARRVAALQPAPDPLQIVDVARGVIDRARALGDDALVAEVLVTAGAAMVDYAPIDERIERWRELLALATRTGDVPKILRARARLAMDLLQRGSFDEFDVHTDELLRVSAEYGHPRYRWQPLLFASMRACMRGQFDESDRHLVEIEQLAALTDDPALGLCLMAHRSQRARDVASPDELRRMAAGISELVANLPMGHLVAAILRSEFFTWAGDRDAAAAELAIIRPFSRMVMCDVSFRVMVASTAHFAGDDELRKEARAALLPFLDEEGPTGHVPVSYEGSIVRMVGLLDLALGDTAKGRERLTVALERARANGLAPWVARIERELGTAAPTVAAPASPPPAERLRLEREGEAWRIRSGGREVVVRDVRGMRLLARLVDKENEEIHVLVLASDEEGSLAETHAGDRVDAKSLADYRSRLTALAEDLDEAERMADLGRARKIAAERAALEAEIAGAVGLGGRARKAGSATERARVNVQRRLRDAISRISEADETIGKYVERSVRTGTYCCFRP